MLWETVLNRLALNPPPTPREIIRVTDVDSLTVPDELLPKVSELNPLKGASRHQGKWRACIFRDGKNQHLGSFNTELEAHQAYLAAAGSTTNYKTKIDADDVREIRKRLANGETQTLIAKSFNITKATISQIALGRTWKHVK